ncbi:hypothetical protein MRY87_00020 [bacterium]|nr:hypothetical protein [bacterium]
MTFSLPFSPFFPTVTVEIMLREELKLLSLSEDRLASTAFEEEEQYALRFQSTHRREQFLLGRKLIRTVHPAFPPVLRHPDRSPSFPPGFSGSLSHSGEYYGFACSASAPVGLDIQEEHPCSPNFITKVATTESERIEPAVRLFSAKEAAYKALSSYHKLVFFPRRLTLERSSPDTFSVIQIGGGSPHLPITVAQHVALPWGSGTVPLIISVASTKSP